MTADSRSDERDRLVRHLTDSGLLSDPRVAQAMRVVPRDLFVPTDTAATAYADHPAPIGFGQTISAPHMVAIMCDRLELRPGHRVLEVGTGSGYHAAVVATLVAPHGRVTTFEYVPDLAERARTNLRAASILNVDVRVGDGARGAPDAAPFDRIYLACTAHAVPPPLLEQLAQGGILIAPIGGKEARLIRLRKGPGAMRESDLGPVAFVPLRGDFGQA